jgi:hypothetical protein
VIANVDGTISVSLIRGLNGQPKRWREVSPFVWRDVDGKDRIAARVDGNRVVMFSTDQASPFLVLQPVPVWKSAAWLLPALVSALMVLALALITWPVAAFVRRRYGSSLSLSRRDARVQLTARIAALAMLVSFLGFVVTVSSLRADLTLATPKLDPLIWTLQILAVPVFVGAPAISLWNSWLTWAGDRAWTAKIGSLMVTAACCIVLWTALAFHLIGFGANY